MGDLIRFKRGLKANLPTLEVGEFAYCTDTKEVFIGTSTGNQNIISSRLANFQNYFDQVKEVQDQDIQQDIRFNKLVEDYYNMFGGNGLLTQEITTETANLSKRATKNAPMKVAGFGKTEGKNKVAYVNKTIDDPIAELNGHTLREVFEGGNIIEDNEFKSLSNWNLVRATPTLLDDGVKLNVISTLSTEYGYIWQNILSDIIPNNNYYHWVELTTLSPEYYGSTLMQYTNLGNVPQGNNIPYQSGRYKISFEANSLTGTYTIAHFRMHLSNGSGGDIILHNIGMINKNALGITSLTKEQIDYYYSLYVARKNITKKLLTYADIFEEKNLMTNYDILRVGNNSTYYMSITTNGIQWNNNQKYYRYIEVKNNFNSSEYKTTYYASTVDVGFRSLGGLITPTENEYHKFSDIYTWVYNSQYTPFRIYSETFAGTNLQSNDELHIRNWELISFEHFDELITKEQLDTMLVHYLLVKNIVIYPEIYVPIEPVGLGNRFKLLAVDDTVYGHELDFEDISFKMYFGVNFDAYKGYHAMMNMLRSNKAIIEYDWGIGPRYNDVRLLNAPKTEKDTSLLIISKFYFKRLNPFYELIEVSDEEDMKNESDLDSPVKLDLTVSNTTVSIKLLDTSSGVQQEISFDFTGVSTPFNLTIDPETKKLLIDDITDAYDYADHTKDSFIYLPGDSEIYSINITGAAVNKITYKKWVIS
jgi:hypothetical protein